jgi:hypothetical protein
MSDYIPPTFDDLIADAVQHTLETGFHLPTVFAVGTKIVAVMIGDMPGTHDERAAVMYFLGFQTARQPIGQLRDVVFVMEAWMAHAEPGETEMRIRPSEHPQRKEILALSHYSLRESKLELVSYEMIRDASGKLIDLVKNADTRTDKTGVSPESGLVDAYIQGYLDSRRGQLPQVRGPRG